MSDLPTGTRKVPYSCHERKWDDCSVEGGRGDRSTNSWHCGAARPRTRPGSAVRPSSPPSWSTASRSARRISCCGWRRSSTFSSPRRSGCSFPLLVLDAAQASHETIQDVMSVCMLALGVGTILFCLNARDLGSGYLMPASFSGVYFSVSILAAQAGRPPAGRRHDHVRRAGPASAQPFRSPAARLSADRDRRLRHADERIHARGGRLQPDHRRFGADRNDEGRDGRAGAARRRLRLPDGRAACLGLGARADSISC